MIATETFFEKFLSNCGNPSVDLVESVFSFMVSLGQRLQFVISLIGRCCYIPLTSIRIAQHLITR